MSVLRTCGSILAISTLLAAPAAARESSLFQNLVGTWTGTGSATVAGGGSERLSCRAAYAPSGSSLRLQLVCASDSYKLQADSNLQLQGDRLTGSFSEASTGASGSVNGTARGDRLDASLAGSGLTARLSLALQGDTQSVTLVTSGPLAAKASVVLRRR